MSPIEDFSQSYLDHQNYPCNLLHQPLYTGARGDFAKNLSLHSGRLFREEPPKPDTSDPQVRIRFRDLGCSGGQAVNKYQANSDNDVDRWLNHQDLYAVSRPGDQPDPKCRFIFLRGDSSRSRLYSTLASFQKIASWHQVMPELTDLLPVLGQQLNIKEPGLFGFREQNLAHGRGSVDLDALGRSASQYQMCYTLRSAAPADAASIDQTWNFRPAVVHHQFHFKKGTSLWLIASGNDDLYRLVQKVTHETKGRSQDRDYSTQQKAFRNTLGTHLIYVNWAMANWRTYVGWLTKTTDAETEMVVLNDRLLNGSGYPYNDNDLSRIQRRMESINKAVMVIAGNHEVVRSLRKFYHDLKDNEVFDSIADCRPEVEDFISELRNIENAFEGERDRCIYLYQVASGRKELVSQHLQGQTNSWMRVVTDDSLKVARDSHHQAIVMKIIAGVTLFYLPATFVSTFFSTDVIKYQGVDSPMGNYSATAMERWGEVTAGLTVVTVLIALAWWAWSSWDKRKQRQGVLPRWEPSEKGPPAKV